MTESRDFEAREHGRMAPAPFTVVVVDDNADMRELLGVALVGAGRFEVVAEAADGPAAVAAVAQHQPDLLLLDLAMPGGGGLEALPGLRAASPGTRVVVVSGFPGERLASLVRERGAVGYVEKGLSPRRTVDEVLAVAGVLDSIEQVLASRRRTLEPDTRSSAAARRFMEETLGRWRCDELLDVVNLLVSELVTNAIVHGGSEADVSVVLTPSALRVEVADAAEVAPRPRDADDWATSGRGLALVETMARSWGIESVPGGKVVWFEVDRPDR